MFIYFYICISYQFCLSREPKYTIPASSPLQCPLAAKGLVNGLQSNEMVDSAGSDVRLPWFKASPFLL